MRVSGQEADRARLEEVYRTYRGLMFHVAKGILRNDEDAEDAVHEAFLAISRHLSKLPEPACPQTQVYVVTVVQRKAIDLYRSRRRCPAENLDELSLSGGPAMPEGTLAAAMAALPPSYREVLLLKYHCGYRGGEIAELLSTTPENVRQTLVRARRRLAEALAERGEKV